MASIYSADVGRPNVSISASDSNAAGDVFGLVRGGGPGLHVTTVTMQVAEVNGGAYSALAVNLQGSVDNVNWVTLTGGAFTTALTANATGTVSANTEGYNYFRANKASSGISAGTPKITATLSFGA